MFLDRISMRVKIDLFITNLHDNISVSHLHDYLIGSIVLMYHNYSLLLNISRKCSRRFQIFQKTRIIVSETVSEMIYRTNHIFDKLLKIQMWREAEGIAGTKQNFGSS